MFICHSCTRFLAERENACPFCGATQDSVTAHRALGILAGLTLGLGGSACTRHPVDSVEETETMPNSNKMSGTGTGDETTQSNEWSGGGSEYGGGDYTTAEDNEWSGGGSDYGGGDYTTNEENEWSGGGSEYGGGDWEEDDWGEETTTTAPGTESSTGSESGTETESTAGEEEWSGGGSDYGGGDFEGDSGG